MHRLIPALALMAIAGCGGPRLTIDSDYEPSTDFSKYKTWMWVEGAKMTEKDIDSLSQQRIRAAVEAELPAHGLKKADQDADLGVAFHISVQRKIESSPATVGVGYGWGPAHIGVSKNPTRTYDEGTLILDLIDPRTKTLIWRGIARGTVDPDASPEDRKERIRNALAHLMEDYPPKKK